MSRVGKMTTCLLFAAFIASCDGAKSGYEWGVKLEQSNRPIQAMEAYEAAIQKDPSSHYGKLAAERLALLREWLAQVEQARLDDEKIADEKRLADHGAWKARRDSCIEDCKRRGPAALDAYAKANCAGKPVCFYTSCEQACSATP